MKGGRGKGKYVYGIKNIRAMRSGKKM